MGEDIHVAHYIRFRHPAVLSTTRGPDYADLIGPRTFGLTMIIIGLLALLLAALQYRSAIEALKLSYPEREHYPAIRRSNAWLLGILIALLGLLAIVSALFRG